MRKSEKKSIICAVTNLSVEFCKRVKEARRKAGLSQSVLAKEVGCKQSALSGFEQGDGTKLNDEAVRKLSERFGIPIEEETASQEHVPAVSYSSSHAAVRGFCPNLHCPSNHAYQVEDRNLLRPEREECDPAFGKFCVVCGEVLEKKCPNCGAPLNPGAFCTICGEPYISTS